MSLKPELHNKSDLAIKERVVKALQIELFKTSPEGIKARSELLSRPKIEPLVIGTTLNRDELYKNIEIRLRQRIQEGMIDEVENLHKQYSWERLEKLGLEYRFVSFYLEGKISSKEEMMRERLAIAIHQFAKRQMTWFRGMERKGVKIHWLPRETSKEARYFSAVELIEKYVPEF